MIPKPRFTATPWWLFGVWVAVLALQACILPGWWRALAVLFAVAVGAFWQWERNSERELYRRWQALQQLERLGHDPLINDQTFFAVLYMHDILAHGQEQADIEAGLRELEVR